MFRLSVVFLSLLAVASLLLPQAGAAEFILNGSFESPAPDATWYSFYGGQYTFATPTSWQSNGEAAQQTGVWRPIVPSNPLTLSYVPDGKQVGVVNKGYMMFQDSTAKLTAGITYTVGAYVGSRADFGGAGRVTLRTTDGNVLATGGTVSPAGGQFQSVLFSYTPTAGDPYLGKNLRVVLECVGGYVQSSFDKVSLTAVPVPSSFLGLLSLGGVAVVGLVWRRRRGRSDD